MCGGGGIGREKGEVKIQVSNGKEKKVKEN